MFGKGGDKAQPEASSGNKWSRVNKLNCNGYGVYCPQHVEKLKGCCWCRREEGRRSKTRSELQLIPLTGLAAFWLEVFENGPELEPSGWPLSLVKHTATSLGCKVDPGVSCGVCGADRRLEAARSPLERSAELTADGVVWTAIRFSEVLLLSVKT